MSAPTAQKYGPGLALNIGSMTINGPNMRDGSVDDTATYVNNSDTSGGITGGGICAYIDLGTDQNFDQARFTIYGDGDANNKYSVAYSTNAQAGTTWTALQTNAALAGGAFHSQNRSYSTTSARYVRIEVKATTLDNSTPWETRISDFRLYLSGVEYVFAATTKTRKTFGKKTGSRGINTLGN